MNTTIRELVYKDRRKLSEMIKKLSIKLNDNSLLTQLSSEPKKHSNQIENDSESDTQLMKIGLNLFNQLIQFLEDDVTEWFADLLGITIEEYINNAPFDIEILIIQQLMDDKGKFKSFLAGASKLYKSIKTSLSNLRTSND